MNGLSLNLLCQGYRLLILLAATILAALPYSLVALALLLAVLLTALRPRQPKLKVSFDIAILFLMPLVLASLLERLISLPPIAAQLIPVALILPIIYRRVSYQKDCSLFIFFRTNQWYHFFRNDTGAR